jgi:hypothetical protein
VLLGIVAFIFGVATIAQGHSATLPHTTSAYDLRGAEVYSTFCVDSETGDVNGLRVFVRRPDQTPRILVQYAEGSLGAPEVARSAMASGRLIFTVSDELDGGDVHGEVRGDHVMLRRDAGYPQRLRMERAPWQNKAPYCRD